MAFTLSKPCTDEQRVQFLDTYLTPTTCYRFYEDDNMICLLEANEIVDESGQIAIDLQYEEKLKQSRQKLFEQSFFNTSLGYIRRKVNMLNGETKDFISDILPILNMGLQLGTEMHIITYQQPDFNYDMTEQYLISLQQDKIVTAQFIQECAIQLSNDFSTQDIVIQ